MFSLEVRTFRSLLNVEKKKLLLSFFLSFSLHSSAPARSHQAVADTSASPSRRSLHASEEKQAGKQAKSKRIHKAHSSSEIELEHSFSSQSLTRLVFFKRLRAHSALSPAMAWTNFAITIGECDRKRGRKRGRSAIRGRFSTTLLRRTSRRLLFSPPPPPLSLSTPPHHQPNPTQSASAPSTTSCAATSARARRSSGGTPRRSRGG